LHCIFQATLIIINQTISHHQTKYTQTHAFFSTIQQCQKNCTIFHNHSKIPHILFSSQHHITFTIISFLTKKREARTRDTSQQHNNLYPTTTQHFCKTIFSLINKTNLHIFLMYKYKTNMTTHDYIKHYLFIFYIPCISTNYSTILTTKDNIHSFACKHQKNWQKNQTKQPIFGNWQKLHFPTCRSRHFKTTHPTHKRFQTNILQTIGHR
jgi:hypothetical protein